MSEWTVGAAAAAHQRHGGKNKVIFGSDWPVLRQRRVVPESGFLAHGLDTAASMAARPDFDGPRLLDDDSVAYRLGRVCARFEVAASTPNLFGRVAVAQTMRDCAPDLMDILGAASALSIDTPGAADDGAAGYVYRFAPLAGIYGGTLEVFRNMIAQHVLGLGRPNYTPQPKQVARS